MGLYCIIKYFDARPMQVLAKDSNLKRLNKVVKKLNKKARVFTYKLHIDNGEFDYLPADIQDHIRMLKENKLELSWTQTEFFKVG